MGSGVHNCHDRLLHTFPSQPYYRHYSRFKTSIVDPMSGFEVVSAVQALGATAIDRAKLVLEIFHQGGITALTTFLILPTSAKTFKRIRGVLQRHIATQEDTHVLDSRRSVISNMSMIGVAGAILAQVALTSLTLNGIEQAHWTAGAFFISSLVFGLLSVYFSFFVQQELNDLIDEEAMVNWLLRIGGREPDALVWSAAMITAPTGLVILAVISFFSGLGVYLGCVYTANLIPDLGKTGSLGMLIFYLVATTVWTLLYFLRWWGKVYEAKRDNAGQGHEPNTVR
ncbi:hypothetical protein QBC38DRAFT_488733 [Podospora fimiseda]|uniref:Uncharacterized protein n=1 Tax=Podospora fimiseda TaxID=252190 RepID=A0AAN7BG59_9PEZI|nr:hypothetical protein QBC38DRAFT_488733 [Podospora fimiseda]